LLYLFFKTFAKGNERLKRWRWLALALAGEQQHRLQ
jgi:hypothetical protein